jgi:outer membrane receptor protein involved in Fe transport
MTQVMTSADAFEAGARLQPDRGLSVSLTGFATFIERESVYDHLSGLTFDRDATRRLGAELALGLRPAEFLEVRADLTYVNASFVASKNPVPMVPPLASSLLVMLGKGQGPGAALRLGAIAPRPLPLGARSRARVTVDGTAHYLWQRLRFDLEVENVLDQALYDGEYYFASRWQTDEVGSYLPAIHYVAAAPRTLRLAITARF